MQIIALRFVSMSELVKVLPDITYDWIDENPTAFSLMLYELGVNTNQSIEVQELYHYNFFREAVFCKRWVGNERTDETWLKRGYASQAAKDKSKDSKLLIDLYRLKGEVE